MKVDGMNRVPDFYIVGGPKCGTTALFEYLNQHPQIFMPNRKEINYFGKDLQFKNYNMDFDYYCSLFSNASKTQVIGEASVWSLYSKKAAKEIFKVNPDSKIIIILRDPTKLIYSLYYELLHTGDEDAKSFEDALSLESQRTNGECIPKRAFAIHSTRYRDIATFSKQVKRYLDVFGEERVKILIQEEMNDNTMQTVKDVYSFLQVNEQFIPNIKKHNINKTVRFRWLRNLVHRPPIFIRKIARFIIRNRSGREVLTSFMVLLNKKVNTRYSERPKINKPTDKMLRSYFKRDIEKLEKLINKDLSHWL